MRGATANCGCTQLSVFGKLNCPILFSEHHLSHAASAFFPSPFSDAAILTVDGVGEWATSTIAIGKGKSIEILEEAHFPHSVGLLYSAFTYYLGFKVNSGEYKLMGLAPYSAPGNPETQKFKELIYTHFVNVKYDGSIFLNLSYFSFPTGSTMADNRKWEGLFGFPRRKPEGEISDRYINLAAAIQEVCEDIMLKMAKHAHELTGMDNLTMAGGVALNCVINKRLKAESGFKNIWIQPAAGDAGGALGACLAGWYIYREKERIPVPGDGMTGTFLGPEFTKTAIEKVMLRYDAKATHYPNFNELCDLTAQLLAEGNVIGWFQGRMEFGPRALGNRSILADPRREDMQQKLNLKIKFRESFRPFAPAVLEECMPEYFKTPGSLPYMLFTAGVADEYKRRNVDFSEQDLNKRLKSTSAKLPAVTHVDNSARVQSVNKSQNSKFYHLIQSFYKLTGCPVLINTSFNVRGEPLVCTPEDAYRCFMATDMDYLVIENYLFRKEDQPENLDIIKGALGLD